MDFQADKIAYFSGLFDGEGSVLIAKNPPRAGGVNASHQLSLSLRLTYESSIAWLRETFGGAKSGPYKTRLSTKPYWSWSLNGEKAASLLKAALPYLQVKRREAELAIGFQRLLKFQNGGWTKVADRSALKRPALNTKEISAREAFRETLLRQRNYQNKYDASEDGLSSR